MSRHEPPARRRPVSPARFKSRRSGRSRALRLEALEERALMAYSVTLGNVANLSEGFGFGSTIDGLNSALNLSVGTAEDAATYTKPLGVSQSNAFTEEFWLYPQANAQGELFRFVNTGNNGLNAVTISGAGKDIAFDGLGSRIALSGVLNSNAWNHVAETFDGTNVRVYINGNQVYTSGAFGGAKVSEPSQLIMGSTSNQPGVIDELRIWSVARSQSEIQKGMLDLPVGNEPGLAAYYKFDGNLNDATGRNAAMISLGTPSYVNNPAPQVGYVTVNVDQPVKTGIGLPVTYNIAGGSATEGTDYTDSHFRTDAFNPATDQRGIIIPDGQTSGRIYFVATGDALAEGTETINVALTAQSSYNVGAASTASLTLTDNDAYKPGLAGFTVDGQAVSSDAAVGGIPLYLGPTTGSAGMDFRLTSQPTGNVTIQLAGNGYVFFKVGSAVQTFLPLTFTKTNWDQAQRVVLSSTITSPFNGQIIATQTAGPAYLSSQIKLNVTNIPPTSAQVGEGSATDGAPITPTANLVAVHGALEGNGTGALIRATLDAPAPAAGLTLNYQYSITSATSVGTFTGGDLGDGLDLDGNFVYAVNMAGAAAGAIRDATFTTPNVPGVTYKAPNAITNFFVGNFGTSPNDAALKSAMQGVRFTADGTPVTLDLANLTPGVEYKLQLLFAEASSNRGFDVLVDGQTIANDLNVGQVQGGVANRTKGVVVTDDFVATASTVHIVLNGQAAPYPDKNPTLNAFTLEQLPSAKIAPLSGTVQVQPGARNVDIPIVVSDDSIAGPSRTVAIALTSGTGYNVGTSPSASVVITDDDKPGIGLSNFTQSPTATGTGAPNDTQTQATDLGTFVGGRISKSGAISSTNTVDWYKFTIDTKVAVPQSIVPTVTGAGSILFQVYNSTGSLVDSTTLVSGQSGLLYLGGRPSGTYFLKISDPTGKGGNYSFLAHGTDVEPNDNFGVPVDLGTALPGAAYDGTIATANDQDFYKFTSDDRTATIDSVTVTIDNANAPVSLILYDANGNPIDATSVLKPEATGASLTLGLSVASKRGPGTYFLRVAGVNGATGHYTISFAGMRIDDYVGVFSDNYSTIVLEQSPTSPVSQQFGLRLSSQPSGPVTLTLATASSGTSDAATLSTKTVTFTTTNWDVYQLVTVTPIDNPMPTGLQDFTITATGASSDPQYANRILRFDVLVEDDQQFIQPPVTSTPQDPNLPHAVLPNLGTSVTEGGTISFNAGLTKPASTATYVGIGFDPSSTLMGKDFTISSGLVTDQHAFSDAFTALKLGGAYNVPRFVDINGDGLLDLFVGSATGPLRFFRNEGTKTDPRFVEKTGTAEDPFSAIDTGSLGGYLYPAFADVDGNGTIDLVLGSRTGLTYFRNDGTPQIPRFSSILPIAGYNPFQAMYGIGGSFFAPVFADLYGTGKPDLYIPRQGNGTIAYFKNVAGTFTRNDAASPVSGLGVGTTDTPTLSFADLNGDNVLDAIVGLGGGSFARLNLGTRTSPNLATTNYTRFFQVTTGISRPAWTVADIDGDGITRLYTGDSASGLFAMQSYLAAVIPAGSVQTTVTLRTVDNPIDEGSNRTIDVRLLQSSTYIIDSAFGFTDTNDLNGNGNRSETLRLPIAGSIALVNNDKAGIVVAPPKGTTVNETGTTQTLAIQLASQPVASVSVFVTSSDPLLGPIAIGTNAGAASVTLTFTPANWNVPQSVNVLGVSDSIDDGDRQFKVTATSSSADVPYDRLSGAVNVFTHVNNDTSGVTVSSPQQTLQGRANVFGVSLNTQPVGQVHVTMTPVDGQISIDGATPGDPETLTFDASNWNLPQYVQVTAADDGIVQYFHTSQIQFSVQTGTNQAGSTPGVHNTNTTAYDLGTLADGFNWSGIPLSQTYSNGAAGNNGLWFKFTLTRYASPRDAFRTLGGPTTPDLTPSMFLYNSDLTKSYGQSQKRGSSTLNGITTPATSTLSLAGLAPGVYYLQVSSLYNQPDTFRFLYDNSDRLYESVAPPPITVSIKDNDLPTAQITPGLAPSEVFSQPGTFVVKLNAPAPAPPGDSGIKVNFQITGGMGILGDSTTPQDDFSINADFFDPVTKTGWVRVAPGDVQANIGVIPVDNKLVSSVPLSLRSFTFDPTNGYQVRVAIDPAALNEVPKVGNTYVLKKGTIITGILSASKTVTFTVRADTTLLETYYTSSAGTALEYAAAVPTSQTEADAAAATAFGFNNTFAGRLQAKDVEVTLLPGSGYVLPQAPGTSSTDTTRTVARMTIFDDDVPGVRVTRVGEDTPIAEGAAPVAYAVSLLAQPSRAVTITLTPQGNIAFVNPANPGTGSYSATTYTLDMTNVPSNLDLRLATLVNTDSGWTASLQAKLRTVSYGASNATIGLTLADTKGGGNAAVTYQVPAAGATDAGGQPLKGTWDRFQPLIVSNLTPRADASGSYFEMTLTLNGKAQTIRINAKTAATPTAATTTTLTFDSSNWFQAQTVLVQAKSDAIAQPGSWYEADLGVKTASSDLNWNGLPIPPVAVHVADIQLDSGATAQAITSGFEALKNSLSDVKLPLVGSLLAFAPQVGDVFDSIEQPLTDDLKGTSGVTVDNFSQMADVSLAGETDDSSHSFFDDVTVEPQADSDGVSLSIHLEKTWNLFGLNLDGDLGLDALGLSLTTEGSINATATLSIDFTFGLSRTFGFYIDTAKTGIDAGLKVALDGFAATGHLGFLQLDLADDAENPSELSIAFHAGLNDLDNYQTIQFFDVNGDGLLAPSAYPYPIGVDSNKDGKIDAKADGSPNTVVTTVAEPWQNVNSKGVPVNGSGAAADFPTVSTVKATSLGQAGGAANFNGNNTFDEAVNEPNEGVYRKVTRGAVTIYYFDANDNGKLDVSTRGVDPYTTSWTSLTSAQKDQSEIWIASNNSRWVNGATGTVNPFLIQTKGTGANVVYYFDASGNTVLDANEQISAKLRKQLDKNKDGILNPAVQKDGEGTFVRGTGIAFNDLNGNGRLDPGEQFVNSGFDDLQFSDDAFTTSGNTTFLDLDGTGNVSQFPMRTTSDGTRYIDLNSNGVLDSLDPQATGDDPITVPSQYNGQSLFITAAIKTDAGGRFLDLIGNGVFDANKDIRLDVKDSNSVALGFGTKTPAAYFGITDYATTFTFFDADGNGKLNSADYQVLVSAGQEYLDLDRNGMLTGGPDDPLEPTAGQNNTFDLSKLGSATSVVKLLNDGDRLTLTELRNFVSGVRSDNATKTDQLKASLNLFSYSFTGSANLGLTAVTSVEGNPDFPSLSFNLGISFPLFNYGDQSEAADTGFTVDFNDVTLDLGSFLTSFAEPVLDTVDQVLTPFKPIIQVLNADTKLPAALGLDSFFEADGRPGTSLLEIARKISGGDPQIDAAIKFADTLTQIVDTVDSLKSMVASGQSTIINFGDFSIDDFHAASDDAADTASNSRGTTRSDGQRPASAVTRNPDGSTSGLNRTSGAAAQAANVANSKGKSSVFSKLSQLDGFSFDILNPDTIISLLMGEEDVNLITYDIPDFNVNFKVSKTFPIWGPLAGLLEGNFNVGTDLAFGFDTHGFQEWAKADFAVDQVYQIFDGFYVSDLHGGTDRPELFASATIAAGAGIDVGIASGFVKGGVTGTIGLDLVDQGEADGTSDGKVRGSEIIDALKTDPLSLFRLNGSVDAFLGAKIEVDFFFFSATVYEETFATFNLAKFTLDSNGFSGTSDVGKLQGGPINGATVWLDANGNGILDPDEPNTLSAADGSYQLLLPDGYDTGTGMIRSQGGVDITTGLPATTSFSGMLGQTVATPLTSLIQAVMQQPIPISTADFNHDGIIDQSDADAFLTAYSDGNPQTDINKDGKVDDRDLGLFDVYYEIALGGGVPTFNQAEQLILLANGLDPSIDLGNTADFDGALANDPTSEAVLTRTDETEVIQAGLRAWLAGAAGLPFNDPKTNVILSDAINRALATQIVTGRFDLRDPATIEAVAQNCYLNVQKALADAGLGTLQTSNDFEGHVASLVRVASKVADVMDKLAAKAISGADLARLITHAKLLAEGSIAQDLYKFGKGEIDDSAIDALAAQFDETGLAKILSLSTPTIVSPITNVIINEDQSPPTVPIHVQNLDFPNSRLSVSVLSDNPDLIRPEYVHFTPGSSPQELILSFTPQPNISGTAVITLTFTDPTGGKTSSEFHITVNPIAHAPVAHNFTVSASRNHSQTFDPSGHASSPDGVALTSTLVGAPAHGTVTANADGTFTYMPDADFVGTETLHYMVSDGRGGLDSAAITFVSTGQNGPPKPRDDAASTWTLTPVIIPVLANDSDANGDVLTVASFTQARHGVVSLNADGSIAYRPEIGFTGTDQFIYVVSDGRGGTGASTVTVTVAPSNGNLSAPNLAFETSVGRALTFNPTLQASDKAGLTPTLVTFSPPTYGAVTRNTDSTLTYTPIPGFVGVDSFTYTLADGHGGSTLVRVNIHIAPAPIVGKVVAPDLILKGFKGGSVAFNPLQFATDVAGYAPSHVSFEQPHHGSVTLNADGTLTYAPKRGFAGKDSFTYVLTDGHGGSATVHVAVDIAQRAVRPPSKPQLAAARGAFVSTLYHEILGREAGVQERAYWTSILSRGGSPLSVATNLDRSPEHRDQIRTGHSTGVSKVTALADATTALNRSLIGGSVVPAGPLASFRVSASRTNW